MLKEVTCDCSVTDLCPEGKMGPEKRCVIMIDADKMFQNIAASRRERDRLWCAALCNILNIKDITPVLTEFLKLRGEE